MTSDHKRALTYTGAFRACIHRNAWQRINLKKAKPETWERIVANRWKSHEYLGTFGRFGRAVIARGGSDSFEWPRHCEGWKEASMQAMLEELKFEQDDVDGCAAGVQSKTGEPILKPWRIAVNSDLMRQALDSLTCQGGHKHTPCSGNETGRSAFTQRTCAT